MRKINKHCPISYTLQLIGGKYKTLLLWHLTNKTLRFNQLRKLIPEATPKMLTQQLREMERDGLVIRKIYPVVPPKVEYSLTERGKSLNTVLLTMYDWGADFMNKEGIKPECSMMGTQEAQGLCGGKCEE